MNVKQIQYQYKINVKQIQNKYETNIRRVGESQYETCCHNCHQLFAAPQPRFVQFPKKKMTKKTHFALLPKKENFSKTTVYTGNRSFSFWIVRRYYIPKYWRHKMSFRKNQSRFVNFVSFLLRFRQLFCFPKSSPFSTSQNKSCSIWQNKVSIRRQG